MTSKIETNNTPWGREEDSVKMILGTCYVTMLAGLNLRKQICEHDYEPSDCHTIFGSPGPSTPGFTTLRDVFPQTHSISPG